MKSLLLFLVSIFICSNSYGQTTFGRTYGTVNDDLGYSVAQTVDGGYIIGTPYDNGQWTIIKTNSLGDTTWIRTYPFLSAALNYQVSHSIFQTSDSNYVMAGALPDSSSFILKVNGTGDTLWLKYSPPAPFPTVYRKVVEDNSGNLVIVGSFEIIQGSACCVPVMIKTDSNGNVIPNWSPAIPCPGTPGCRLEEIFVDNEGNFLVSGDTPAPNVPQPRLAKVDTAGNVVWNKYYPMTNATITGITQAPDSGYILVGPNFNGDDSTYLFKTDKFGNYQSMRKYKANNPGWQAASVDTTNGGYLISGSNGNICLMKVDMNYAFLWTNEFGGSFDESFGQMRSTSDGGCVIVGSTKSFGAIYNDVYIIKTDQNGQAVGINEMSPGDPVSIFPNPFTNYATLQTNVQLNDAMLRIDNIFGQTVKEINHLTGQTITIQRNDLPAGLYIVRLMEGNSVIATKKIMIVD